ncbi:GtrA family protein, partial [Paenibacillus nuruki]|uniref:GtrA family protein n=1 Tax=Paenibacillus nuruki TaxID=1886670 RepID=UPI001586DEE4
MNNKKEIISYLIFGVLTTLINIAVYFLLANVVGMDFKVATSIAWLVSVLFAFFTNKKYVFT